MAKTGSIARLVSDRGFGFITPDTGGDQIFFHASAVEGTDFDSLSSGLPVEYEEGTDERSGRIRAQRVRVRD